MIDYDVEFRLISIQDKEKNIYLPAFTDWNEINKWNNEENLKTIIFTFQDYAKVFLNNKEMVGLVINPYGENLVLNKQQIQSISSESESKSGEKVKIGIPGKYPTDMSSPYFIGVIPFFDSADRSGISTQILFRIDINYAAASRSGTGIFATALSMRFFGGFIVSPYHFGTDKPEDIAKMPIDIQLFDLRVSRSMGRNGAVGSFMGA